MASPESPEQPKDLTPKQEKFVAAYIGEARFNATLAAKIAGYSEKSAARIGYDLKKTPSIRARIDELLEANSLTATEILRELSDVAMRGLHEFIEITRYDKDGNPVAARMDARAKMEALKLLGQNKGMYTEKRELSGPEGSALRIEVVYADPDPDAS